MALDLISRPNASSATFTSLPSIVKRMIFDQVGIKDLKTSRLVCKEWFHLVNAHPRFQEKLHLNLCDQNLNRSVEVLRSLNEEIELGEQRHQEDNEDDDEEDGDNLPVVVLPTPSISHLRVADLTEPIPIYSASRSRIPKSKTLSLYPGITRENLVQLLQYQASTVKHLHLQDFSLVNLNTNCQFLDPRRNWTNLSQFTFEFWYETHKATFLDYTKHVLALGQLLTMIEVPNLRMLSAGIDCPKFLEAYHGRARIKFMDHISHNFTQKFATFLSKWGTQLRRFSLYFHGVKLLPILQKFEHLTNVRRLQLKLHGNDSEVRVSDFGLACRHFNRLIYLELSLPPEFEEVASSALLRSSNNTTLATLVLQNWVTSLKWIRPPADSILEHLEVKWKIHKENLFQTNAMQFPDALGEDENMYEKMKTLKIYLYVDTRQDYQFENVRHEQQTMNLRHARSHRLNWIVQFMPNLMGLEIISTNALITDLVDLPLLISGLLNLRQVDVYDRWKGLHKGIPLYELERWCQETVGVRGRWMENYAYYRIERIPHDQNSEQPVNHLVGQ